VSTSFAPDEDQQALALSVRGLLAKRSDGGAVRRAMTSPRGYDEDVWSLLCDQLGAAALAIPEQYGGAGFTMAETHVVLEELGAALTPSPFLGSAVLVAQALLLAADEPVCVELLPGVADGSRVAALAWAGRSGWSTSDVPVAALRTDGRWTLTGMASHVLDGAVADLLLVLATTHSGIGLFQVDPAGDGVRVVLTPAMDQTLRLARVELTQAPGRLIGPTEIESLSRLRDVAATAVTALQVGAMQRCLDMAVDYSKQRVQFGRPIGSFQALKHRMADMLVDVETSRSISWAAIQALCLGSEDAARLAGTAKAWCSEALNRTAAEMVQIHGGIAITWEHDAHLYFKRAHALSQLFGQPHEHRHRLEALQELDGPPTSDPFGR
jgi:alkylation response protein AidB-like acyl-CoA dehydrogenase